MATAKTQGENQKKTFASASVAILNARQIIQQAEIASIPEIPNLPSHQKAAKIQSNKWEMDIWPLIINTSNEVIDFAITFQQAYSAICGLIPQLEQGKEDAKKQLLLVFEEILIPELQAKSRTSNRNTRQIKEFHTDYEPLYNKFQTDFKEANDVLTKDKEEIREKQKELKDWKDKVANYQVGYTVAAVSLPITAAATLKFSESGVALIVGGILFGVELVTLATMLGLYATAVHHVNDLTLEISDLQEQVAELTVVEHQISGLQKHTIDTAAHSASFAVGWDSLLTSLQETLTKARNTTPADLVPLIEKQLSSAGNEEWSVVLKEAMALLPNGGRLEQKNFKTSANMLKAIDEQAKQGA